MSKVPRPTAEPSVVYSTGNKKKRRRKQDSHGTASVTHVDVASTTLDDAAFVDSDESSPLPTRAPHNKVTESRNKSPTKTSRQSPTTDYDELTQSTQGASGAPFDHQHFTERHSVKYPSHLGKGHSKKFDTDFNPDNSSVSRDAASFEPEDFIGSQPPVSPLKSLATLTSEVHLRFTEAHQHSPKESRGSSPGVPFLQRPVSTQATNSVLAPDPQENDQVIDEDIQHSQNEKESVQRSKKKSVQKSSPASNSDVKTRIATNAKSTDTKKPLKSAGDKEESDDGKNSPTSSSMRLVSTQKLEDMNDQSRFTEFLEAHQHSPKESRNSSPGVPFLQRPVSTIKPSLAPDPQENDQVIDEDIQHFQNKKEFVQKSNKETVQKSKKESVQKSKKELVQKSKKESVQKSSPASNNDVKTRISTKAKSTDTKKSSKSAGAKQKSDDGKNSPTSSSMRIVSTQKLENKTFVASATSSVTSTRLNPYQNPASRSQFVSNWYTEASRFAWNAKGKLHRSTVLQVDSSDEDDDEEDWFKSPAKTGSNLGSSRHHNHLRPLEEPYVSAAPPVGTGDDQGGDSQKGTNLTDVWIQVIFVKIGEVNTLTRSFVADIIIRAKWTSSDTAWSPEIFVENTVGSPSQKIEEELEKDGNGTLYHVHKIKIRGSFFLQMNLIEFPFDLQDLSIIVRSNANVVLKNDFEHHVLHRSVFTDIQEFSIYKYVESYADGDDSPSKPSYDRRPTDRGERKRFEHDQYAFSDDLRRPGLVVSCKVARRFGFYIYTAFLVLFTLFIMSIDCFLENDEVIGERIKHTFMLLLTCVSFKMVTSSYTPKNNYTNHVERYHFGCLLFMVYNCVWCGVLSVDMIMEKINPAQGNDRNIDTAGLASYCGFMFLYHVWFITCILLGPYQDRKEMRRRELVYTAEERARKVD